MKNFKYEVHSYSRDRNTHEKKKEWLRTQGFDFDDYDLKDKKSNYPSWPGIDLIWCFDNPEIALMFKLRWSENE